MIAALRRSIGAYVDRRPAPYRWALALGWAGLIWWLSSRPTGGGSPGFLIVLLFNTAHVFLFGVLAALVHLAIGGGRERRHAWLAIAAAGVFGAIDEWHQSWVPGRHASLWDVGTDLAGATLAVSAIVAMRSGSRAALVACACAAIAAAVTVGGATFA